MNIKNIILALIKEWNISPYDINNGQCEDFAMEIINRMGGYSANITEVCTENFVEFGELVGHYWILYKGKHYDAECPNGTKDWKNLPIFNKTLTNS